MNGQWPLAVVIVAALFFGYCIYQASEDSRLIENVFEDSLTIQRCYKAGYEAAYLHPEDPMFPPYDDEKCVDWFYRGASDGAR